MGLLHEHIHFTFTPGIQSIVSGSLWMLMLSKVSAVKPVAYLDYFLHARKPRCRPIRSIKSTSDNAIGEMFIHYHDQSRPHTHIISSICVTKNGPLRTLMLPLFAPV